MAIVRPILSGQQSFFIARRSWGVKTCPHVPQPNRSGMGVALLLFNISHQPTSATDRVYTACPIENAAHSGTFQKRIECLGCETALLRFAPCFVKNLLQGRKLSRGKLAQPQAHQCLDLQLLICASCAIGLRSLRIKRNRDGSVAHGELSLP
jgi:hypothetical protein